MDLPWEFTTVEGMPEIPAEGNLSLLTLVDKLLTPEEIRAAVEAGDREHREMMKSRKKTRVKEKDHRGPGQADLEDR